MRVCKDDSESANPAPPPTPPPPHLLLSGAWFPSLIVFVNPSKWIPQSFLSPLSSLWTFMFEVPSISHFPKVTTQSSNSKRLKKPLCENGSWMSWCLEERGILKVRVEQERFAFALSWILFGSVFFPFWCDCDTHRPLHCVTNLNLCHLCLHSRSLEHEKGKESVLISWQSVLLIRVKCIVLLGCVSLNPVASVFCVFIIEVWKHYSGDFVRNYSILLCIWMGFFFTNTDFFQTWWKLPLQLCVSLWDFDLCSG